MKRTDRSAATDLTKASTSDKAFGEYSDEQLAYLAQSGDRDAEYVLVERFMGLVKLKARPYFLMGADRADLIQEGAIGLVAAIREYEPDRGGSFRSFAETCIVRQIYSAIKTAARKKHLPLNNYVSLDRNAYEGGSDESESTLMDTLIMPRTVNPEDIIVERESYSELLRRMEEELTELEKQVLVRFLDGLSYTDIADELGKSVKSVDNAIQRVKKKVKKLLRDEP